MKQQIKYELKHGKNMMRKQKKNGNTKELFGGRERS